MLLTPEYLFSGAGAVTPEFLRQHGIRALALDVDNTLTAHNSQALPAAVAAWLDQMKAAGVALMIVSNNTRKRVAPFAASLGLPFVSMACKPLPWGICKAARQLGVSRREFALVGDQLFTDRLGGALAGVTVLVVRPMAPEIKWGIKMRRHLEKPFIHQYYKKGGKLL